MPVVDSSLNALNGVHFHRSIIFSLDFSTSICKRFLLVLPTLKSHKNDMKFPKIKSKIWKDIFIIWINFFCRLNY